MVLREQGGVAGTCALREVWVATWVLGAVIMQEVNGFDVVSWLLGIRCQYGLTLLSERTEKQGNPAWKSCCKHPLTAAGSSINQA